VHLSLNIINEVVWLQLNANFSHSDSHGDFMTWFHRNIKHDSNHNNQPKLILFGITVWCIWLNRNRRIFTGNKFNARSVVHQITLLLSDLLEVEQRYPHMHKPYHSIFGKLAETKCWLGKV
jgi:hypothetical protein